MLAGQSTRLLSDVRQLLPARLTPLLRAVADGIDDAFFELAEHGGGARPPQLQLEAMRECRQRRAEWQAGFLERVERGLAWPPPTGPFGHKLGLLGDEELEESLAVDAMVARAEARLARPLGALNRRLGVLLGDLRLGDTGNPVGPAKLADAFRQAIAALALDSAQRRVVLVQFERHLLLALEDCYAALDRSLAAAGVLPELEQGLPLRQHDPPPPLLRRRGLVDAPGGPLASEAELLRTVFSLLAARGRGAAGNALATAPAEQVSAGLLLGALGRLQQQAAAGEQPAPASLKAQLLEEARRLGARGGVAPSDEHTIDLFGLLFEYVAHDDNLPGPLQALLSQLHLPLLRAALCDRAVLLQDAHPARQLLDELGAAALGWSRHADPGERLLALIRDTVQTLLGRFDGDAGMFERLLHEFRGFTAASRRRAELAEQRTVEAALGRERLQLARRKVDAELAARVPPGAPPWVRQLLLRPWANYLVLLWLRQGESSSAFTEGLDFVDTLCWAADAGDSSADPARLRRELPRLQAQLRQGLATVAYHDVEVDQVASELDALLRWRLGERARPEQPPRSDAAAPRPPPPPLEDQPDPASLDPDLLSRIRGIAPGSWFEFGTDSQAPERARLSWISPLSGRCLFVNRTGTRVAELAPEALARDIEIGVARMLEGAALLQRALAATAAHLAGAQQHAATDAGDTATGQPPRRRGQE